MPVPKPRSGETRNSFISRCASALAKTDSDRPQAQRLAMCYTAWRKPHEDFQRILNNFVSFFDVEGFEMYMDFLEHNGLNDRSPYRDSRIQESFEWVEPSIKYWRMDGEAKYYKTRLISANVSMNENDYTNPEHMRHASSNLAWRPLNLDHFHELRLPFPANRLEVGRMSGEGNCIEAVIRISNGARAADTGEFIQDLIKERGILHPSIEAFPMCNMRNVNGRRVPVCGYYIEEVALLRKDQSLPGDPLSMIFPMPLNEKLSRRILESINIKNEVSETKEMSEEKQADFRETPNRMKCSNCGEVQVDITMTQEEDITCPMCGKPGLELVGLDSGAGAKSQKRNKEEKEMSEQPENASEIEALKAELDSINMRYEADKIKTEQAHNAILEKKDQTIVSLNKETSKLLREKTDAESELSVLKEKVAETVGELAREKTMSTKKIKDLTAERNSYQSKWMNEKQEHSDLQETVDGLREKAVEWRGRFEDVNEKRNKALEEKVKAERKALNEVKERARYQNECADLREQLAEALDKYSKTSKARFEDSKHILKLQEQIKELEDAQSEWEDRQKGYEESLDAARKRIAWADDKLKKAKIAFVKK